MTTLIVTPLPEELDALVRGLARHGIAAAERPVGPVRAWAIPALDVVIAHGGHGKTQFGVQTRYLLDTLPAVGRVVCVGAAGALAGGLN